MITIKSDILSHLHEKFINIWAGYRFGQYLFNQINSYLYSVKGISNQAYAINICRLSDQQFYNAICYDSMKFEVSTRIVSRKEKRHRIYMIALLKKVIEKYHNKSVLELVVTACEIRDSYESPSVLYYIENESIIKGFEIMIKFNM